MANDVKIILTAVDKASGVLKGTTSNVKGMLTAIGAVSGVAIAAGTAIKKIADETVAYNKSIRELTQVTGTGAEEISRIVQVADDWGISIDQVRTALSMMNKNGMAPTIDNLADLADEYVSTTDKTEFAEKAAKLLGRQYTTLIPLLAKGGKAFRDQAAAIDESLLATEASIKSSRDYEVAIDNLNDRVLALKYSIGNVLVPALTAALTPATREVINDQEYLVQRIGDTTYATKRMGGRIVDATKEFEQFGAAARRFNADDLITPLNEIGGAADEANEKLKLIPVALQEIDKASIASTQVEAVNEAFKNGTITATEYDELMRRIGIKYTDLSAQEINQQILLANLTRSYEAGNITLKEYLATIDYMTAAWGKVPRDVTTTYHIKYDKAPYGSEPGPGVPVPGTPGGGGEYGGKKHSGGSVMAGTSYLIGKPGAEEWFTPSTNGTMTPTDKMGGMSVDITINATPGMDVNAVANAVIQKLSIASRTRGAGGYARGA